MLLDAGEVLEKDVAFPGHGVVSEETQELTPSHVRLATSLYRSACSFAEMFGVDPEMVEECRKEADLIESYLPKDEGTSPTFEEAP